MTGTINAPRPDTERVAPVRRQRRPPTRTRRPRRVLIAVAAAVVAAGAAVAVVLAPATAVSQVDVVVAGDAGGTLEQSVRDAAGVRIGEPWLLVDPGAIRARVAGLPEVSSVRVERIWPDRVRIGVAPRRTVAVVGVAGSALEVGPGGRVRRVLGPGEPVPADPAVGRIEVDPSLLGGASPEPGTQLADPIRSAVALLEQLPPSLTAVLADGRLAADGTLDFRLASFPGATLRLGTLDGLPAKTAAAEAMLGGAVDLTCLRTLDVSRPDQPTIERSCAGGT